MKIKKFNENVNFEDIAIQLSNDLKYALKQFGEYAFGDKGPDGVMNIGKYDDMVHDMPMEDISAIFNKFYEIYPNKNQSIDVINSILTNLDDRDDFEDIFKYDTHNIFDY